MFANYSSVYSDATLGCTPLLLLAAPRTFLTITEYIFVSEGILALWKRQRRVPPRCAEHDRVQWHDTACFVLITCNFYLSACPGRSKVRASCVGKSCGRPPSLCRFPTAARLASAPASPANERKCKCLRQLVCVRRRRASCREAALTVAPLPTCALQALLAVRRVPRRSVTHAENGSSRRLASAWL